MNKLQLELIRIRDFFIELFCKLKGHEYEGFETGDEPKTQGWYDKFVCLKCGKII